MIPEKIDGSLRAGKTVYILGPESLLHEALSVCIGQHLGTKCVSVDDPLKARDDANSHESEQILFLINGSEMDYEAVVHGLRSDNGFARNGKVVALFGIPANSGIEKHAFENGVRGFFYRGDKLTHLIKGIDALLRGDIWVSREVLVDFALQRRKTKGGSVAETAMLTEREMQILAFVSIGATNEQIAAQLYVSPHTVKTHLYNIFKKIEVPNRFQAALWAAKNF